MISFSWRGFAAGTATVVITASAVVMTALAVHRELAPRDQRSPRQFAEQPDWLRYAAEGNRVGPVGAPATMVVFVDYQCSACRAFEARIDAERAKHPVDLAIVYRNFPLAAIHPRARAAAVAAECAAEQGKFEAMHGALIAAPAGLGAVAFHNVAQSAQVPDLNAFDYCMRDSLTAIRLARDDSAARRLKLTGTPTTLVAGMRVTGVLPEQALDSLVGSMLAANRHAGER